MSLEDAFGDTKKKAVPLEEALKEPETKEYTKDNLILKELGFAYNIFKRYNEQFPNKKYLNNKKKPTKHFFVWYLERSTMSYLAKLHLVNLPEPLQELVREEMDQDDLTKLLKINAENRIHIEELETERLDLLQGIKEARQEKQDLLQGVKKLNDDADKDMLYKKIQELQSERDELKRDLQIYVTKNGDLMNEIEVFKEEVITWKNAHTDIEIEFGGALKWLYEFMGNMSFCNVDNISDELHEEIFFKHVADSIKYNTYTPTPEEIERLERIEEIINEKTRNI